jgi:hypothetical protein
MAAGTTKHAGTQKACRIMASSAAPTGEPLAFATTPASRAEREPICGTVGTRPPPGR